MDEKRKVTKTEAIMYCIGAVAWNMSENRKHKHHLDKMRSRFTFTVSGQWNL